MVKGVVLEAVKKLPRLFEGWHHDRHPEVEGDIGLTTERVGISYATIIFQSPVSALRWEMEGTFFELYSLDLITIGRNELLGAATTVRTRGLERDFPSYQFLFHVLTLLLSVLPRL